MKKLIRRAVRFKGLTVGLDLHKKFIEYAILDVSGDQVAGGRINSEVDALQKLIAKWKKRGAVQVSIEACGCFLWAFDLLTELLGKTQVHVAQSSKIKVIANSQEKNDANDAWWLAYLLFEGRLPEAFVACGALRKLRISTRELRSYVNLRSDLLRRFASHLAQAGHILPKAWHTSKIKRAVVKKLMLSLKIESGLALRRLYRQIRQLGKEVAFWMKAVKAASESFPAIKTMVEEVPGLGATTAATVYAELGDPKRFRNEKAYAKATGLTPGYRISAGKHQGNSITRAGSAQARWALTQAVMVCLRYKSGAGAQIKDWILQRSQQRKRKKVVVAAARKMAEGIWRLFKLGECWDLAKAFPGHQGRSPARFAPAGNGFPLSRTLQLPSV